MDSLNPPPIIDTNCRGRAGSNVRVPGSGSEARGSIDQPTTRGMTGDERVLLDPGGAETPGVQGCPGVCRVGRVALPLAVRERAGCASVSLGVWPCGLLGLWPYGLWNLAVWRCLNCARRPGSGIPGHGGPVPTPPIPQVPQFS